MEETASPVKRKTAAIGGTGAKVYVAHPPRPGTRIPHGMTLTPASGDIEITFKPSPVLTQTIRNRISRDLTRFQGYLVSLGVPVPIELPPFGIQKAEEGVGTGFPAGRPVYRGSLLVGEKVINDPTRATFIYCDYVVADVLFDDNSPVRPAIGVSPHVNIANLAELQMLGGGLASYLNASFWNRREPRVMWPLGEGLWEMRQKFGREFTDQMVRYALQAMNDNPAKDTRGDIDSYFLAMLKIGDSVMDDNVMSRWPTAASILKKNGLSEEPTTRGKK